MSVMTKIARLSFPMLVIMTLVAAMRWPISVAVRLATFSVVIWIARRSANNIDNICDYIAR